MARKYYGAIGYSQADTEQAPGVVEAEIIERKYYGDVSRIGVRSRLAATVLPDLDITHEFRIVADAYANGNFAAMRYINWAGTNWAIRQVEVQRPRLVIRVGGVYNGPTA